MPGGKTAQATNGLPQAVTATTNPTGLSVVLTYGGKSTPPCEVGTYAVSAVTKKDIQKHGEGIKLFDGVEDSLAVYNPSKPRTKLRKSAKEVALGLIREQRADYALPADYTDGSPLDLAVKAIIDRTAATARLKRLQT